MQEKEPVRVTFELNQSDVELLGRMQEKAGLGSKGELFKNAIVLLRWVIEKTKDGRRILAVNPEEERIKELEMPVLENVRPAGTKEIKRVDSTPFRLNIIWQKPKPQKG